MTLDVTGVLRDAWRMAREDRDILLAISGVLLFVPQFAGLLYWIEPPVFPGFAADEAVQRAYVTASSAWFATNGLGVLAASVLVLLGQIAILLVYVDRRRLDVGGALIAAWPAFPSVVLASIVSEPLGVTLNLVPMLILLGAYLQGRLLLVMPVLLAERPVSVIGAVRASWRRTRGHGLAMAGLACIAVLSGPLVAAPFRLIGLGAGGAPLADPLADPLVALLSNGAAALAVVAGAVFGLLIQVAAYRRLSSGT